jgi:hypothetical protein
MGLDKVGLTLGIVIILRNISPHSRAHSFSTAGFSGVTHVRSSSSKNGSHSF